MYHVHVRLSSGHVYVFKAPSYAPEIYFPPKVDPRNPVPPMFADREASFPRIEPVRCLLVAAKGESLFYVKASDDTKPKFVSRKARRKGRGARAEKKAAKRTAEFLAARKASEAYNSARTNLLKIEYFQ